MKIYKTYYHQKLAEFFQSKNPDKNLIIWKKCAVRTLSELPYQLMQNDKQGNTEKLLCNPLFIDACIKNHLINTTINDLNYAYEILLLNNIRPIRKVIFQLIIAIRQKPDSALVNIVNRLIHIETNEIIKSFLKHAINRLNQIVWLSCQTPFSDKQSISGIIALNTSRNSYFTKKDNYCLEEYDIETHVLKRLHDLGLKKLEIFFISIHPTNGRIANIDKEGKLFVDSCQTQFSLRFSSFFGWFDNGILGVNMQGYLTYFDIIKETVTKIWDKYPVSDNYKLSISDDTHSAVLISDNEASKQEILIINAVDSVYSCYVLSFESFISDLAVLDKEGLILLMVTRTREILLYDLKTKEQKTISSRYASRQPVRGKIINCSLVKNGTRHIAALATTDGELLLWNSTEDSLRRLGEYKGLLELCYIKSMEILPVQNKLVYITDKSIDSISLTAESLYETRVPITDCCLTKGGWFVTVSKYSKRVMWFKNGKYIYDYFLNAINPEVVIPYKKNGGVAVGYNNGSVIRLKPLKEPSINDGWDLFNEPVISIINIDNKRILAASQDGQLNKLDFRNEPREIKSDKSFHKYKYIKQLGNKYCYVACRKSLYEDLLWSLSIIQNKKEEVFFETRFEIEDISSSKDGKYIYAACNKKIICFSYSKGKWNAIKSKEAECSKLAISPDGFIVVTIFKNGLNWLELWSAENDFCTISSFLLSTEPTSLYVWKNNIAVGTIDGSYLILKIQNKFNNKILKKWKTTIINKMIKFMA